MNLQSGLSECLNCQAKNGLNLIVANDIRLEQVLSKIKKT